MLATKLKVINFGTLNVQGCGKEDKKQFIYEDTLKLNLKILGLTKTPMPPEEISTVKQ